VLAMSCGVHMQRGLGCCRGLDAWQRHASPSRVRERCCLLPRGESHTSSSSSRPLCHRSWQSHSSCSGARPSRTFCPGRSAVPVPCWTVWGCRGPGRCKLLWRMRSRVLLPDGFGECHANPVRRSPCLLSCRQRRSVDGTGGAGRAWDRWNRRVLQHRGRWGRVAVHSGYTHGLTHLPQGPLLRGRRALSLPSWPLRW
jgi:hypothetical protein